MSIAPDPAPRLRWLRALRRATTLAPLLAFTLVACGPAEIGELSDDDEEGGAEVPWQAGKADTSGLGGKIVFKGACDPGARYLVAAVGDVLLHGALQVQATKAKDGFRSLWREVADLLAAADVTYANLEGPTAKGVTASGKATADPGLVFDGVVYTSYPQFNYHPRLLDDLVASGVDVVSTANNHALDRRALGVDRTVEALTAIGLPWTGTRARSTTMAPWHTVTRTGGLTLAWLACSYGTNGIPDSHGQVLGCFTDAAAIEKMVRELSSDPTIDAVFVTPHWGAEYLTAPQKSQIDLAHRLLDAGALAVIGSHPHVLEPWERYLTRDGRETFVIYSLGNFVSGQSGLAKRTTILLYLGLTRETSGKVRINGVRHVPLYMHGRETGIYAVKAIDRVGGASSARSLVTSMFGSFNLQSPDQPVNTTPECAP